VYSSKHYTDDEAPNILMNNLESAAIAEPKILPFIVGRAKKQWNRNVVAVGLSSRTLTKETKMQPMAKMPSHDEFLEMFGKVS
jgi:hypothetical protein